MMMTCGTGEMRLAAVPVLMGIIPITAPRADWVRDLVPRSSRTTRARCNPPTPDPGTLWERGAGTAGAGNVAASTANPPNANATARIDCPIGRASRKNGDSQNVGTPKQDAAGAGEAGHTGPDQRDAAGGVADAGDARHLAGA
jgi:hypothetical protein